MGIPSLLPACDVHVRGSRCLVSPHFDHGSTYLCGKGMPLCAGVRLVATLLLPCCARGSKECHTGPSTERLQRVKRKHSCRGSCRARWRSRVQQGACGSQCGHDKLEVCNKHYVRAIHARQSNQAASGNIFTQHVQQYTGATHVVACTFSHSMCSGTAVLSVWWLVCTY
jgi:hypothetical protein